jgi:hypothetical protein
MKAWVIGGAIVLDRVGAAVGLGLVGVHAAPIGLVILDVLLMPAEGAGRRSGAAVALLLPCEFQALAYGFHSKTVSRGR